MANFFPPPSTPLEQPVPVKVPLAHVIRVMTSEGPLVAFAAVVQGEDEANTIYRFTMPDHSRVVRQFFRLAKQEPHRRRETFDVEGGAFLIGFEGICTGQDEISEGIPLKAIYVLDSVSVYAIL